MQRTPEDRTSEEHHQSLAHVALVPAIAVLPEAC